MGDVDIASLLAGMGTADPASPVTAVSPAAAPAAGGMSKITIAVLVVLVVGLLVAAYLAWRNYSTEGGGPYDLDACPDPDRRLDLAECQALLGRAKRAWVVQLLRDAIEQSLPHGASPPSATPPSASASAPAPMPGNGAAIEGGSSVDNDPLFDGA